MTKAPDEAPTPSLRGLIDRLIDQKLETVEGPMPARVTSYDATKQRITAQPLVQRVYYDEVGERKTKTRPIVQDVPVWLPGGNGTRITTGLATGDTVLLIPCGPSIARWIVRGGEVDPGESSGSLSDCIALAGLHDYAHVPTTAPTDAIVTHGTTLLGGPDATELVAWQSAFTQLANAFTSWTPVPNDGGAALKTILSALISGGWPQGATIVKAK